MSTLKFKDRACALRYGWPNSAIPHPSHYTYHTLHIARTTSLTLQITLLTSQLTLYTLHPSHYTHHTPHIAHTTPLTLHTLHPSHYTYHTPHIAHITPLTFHTPHVAAPLHWIYDQGKVQDLTKGHTAEFYPTSQCPFYTIETGRTSTYGDQLHVTLKSLAERKGILMFGMN